MISRIFFIHTNLIKDLTLATLKKIKIHVETLHTTKSKEEKAATKGGKKKGKGSTVKMDLNKVGIYTTVYNMKTCKHLYHN